MADEKVVVYGNGEVFEIDKSLIYNPFPDPPKESMDEESQDSQSI